MNEPVRIAQVSFVGGEVAPELYARVDLEKYGYALKTALNVILHRYGGASARPGTQFIGEVQDSSKVCRITPFSFSASVKQNYIHEWGEHTLRVIMDGGYVLETAKVITAITKASPGVFTSVAHGLANNDQVYVGAILGPTELNGRYVRIASAAADTFQLVDMYGAPVSTAALAAYVSGGTVARLYINTSQPYDNSELFAMGLAQQNDRTYHTHLSYAPKSLTRSAHANWTFATVAFGASVAAPTGELATPTGAGAITYGYVVTALGADGAEGPPSAAATCANDLAVSGQYNIVTWSAVGGAVSYNVYRDRGGSQAYGWVGAAVALTFTDDNILPDFSITPPQANNPFNGAGKYPKKCKFHDNRLWFGQTLGTPSGIWASQSSRAENLDASIPAKATDAIALAFTAAAYEVRGFASLKKLGVFTSKRELALFGEGNNRLAADSLDTSNESAYGCADDLDPLEVGDSALFVQKRGNVIRAFGYSFEKDGYLSNDLTLFAPHLFKTYGLVDWSYAQEPHAMVWCVRADGVLCTLTFYPDQNVFAFARHILGGSYNGGAAVVESVATIEGASQDEVHFVVKRTINGFTKRYIERLKPLEYGTDIADAWFLDSALLYTGTAASYVTGLHHLEGQTVSALVNGALVEGLVVAAGRVDLPEGVTGTKILVGLPPPAPMIEPVPLDRTGGTTGKIKSVPSVTLRVKDTVALLVGARGVMRPAKMRNGETWNQATQPKTGVYQVTVPGTFSEDGEFTVQGVPGLPMNILSWHPDVTLGG